LKGSSEKELSFLFCSPPEEVSSPLGRTVSPGISSASSKTPPSVDKCHLRAPYIHTRHLLCGQAATILLSVHKNAPIRGQMPPAGTIRPHQAPYVWTGGNYFSSASTKTPPSVDKCHLRAPHIHTRHPLCRQAATISPPRPQKRPHPWTNATCGHHTSTPGTLCVDRRQLFSSASTKTPHPWTNANCGHHTSTPGTLSVDRRQLFLLRVHKRHLVCGQQRLVIPYITY